MNTKNALRLATAIITAGTFTACSPGGSTAGNGGAAAPSPSPGAGHYIDCSALADYIVANSTFANLQQLDPLIAELVRCSRLTSDQARGLLDDYLTNSSELDATIAAVTT